MTTVCSSSSAITVSIVPKYARNLHSRDPSIKGGASAAAWCRIRSSSWRIRYPKAGKKYHASANFLSLLLASLSLHYYVKLLYWGKKIPNAIWDINQWLYFRRKCKQILGIIRKKNLHFQKIEIFDSVFYTSLDSRRSCYY